MKEYSLSVIGWEEEELTVHASEPVSGFKDHLICQIIKNELVIRNHQIVLPRNSTLGQIAYPSIEPMFIEKGLLSNKKG